MPTKKNDESSERVIDKLDMLKDHIDEHLGEVKTRLNTMDGRLNNLDVTSGKQQVILDEHVKRTNLLESKMEDDKKALKEELKPLHTQATQIKLAVKIAGAFIAAGGLGGGGFFIRHFFAAFFGGH